MKNIIVSVKKQKKWKRRIGSKKTNKAADPLRVSSTVRAYPDEFVARNVAKLFVPLVKRRQHAIRAGP